MQITEVRVYPRNEEKLKAFVTVTFDDSFVVRNLKVIQGQNGLFVAMPSRKMADGSHKDIAHPIKNEVRRMIEEKVLAAYQEKIKQTPLPTEFGGGEVPAREPAMDIEEKEEEEKKEKKEKKK